ncbi:MAG: PEP-CTERM sorting domain-containing protein [Deltaproteobacteria bacterium]|jgi:hypothetical protein|nr:PEP-CTERM sorting domain-containing protein [Deltaproteobacteria bacterium]MBW2541833.1 PEP-CTERM sorting domain-containing protein [Deltaproteobacteria bacterium]
MKSIFQLALMLSALAAALVAPTAVHAEACVYGACDATVCDTTGVRTATNWPCDGSQTIACSAPACPSCTYNACTATICGTTGTQSANNWPCVGEPIISCDAPACPPCVYSPCNAPCGGGIQGAANEPCTGASSQACNTQTCPVPGNLPFYLRSSVGAPWGASSNEAAMDVAFGVGGWVDERYETVDTNALFADASFIFMEGSSTNADEMEVFVDSHLSEINAFLWGGGVIFFNAAPNEGDGMRLPDGVAQSITLDFDLSYSTVGNGPTLTALPGHPIFGGPLPTSTVLSGNSFSHAFVTNVGITSLLEDEFARSVLAERLTGQGLALYGGMTTTNWHDPQPEADNLRTNILAYGDAMSLPEPSSSAGLAAGLSALSLFAARRRRRRSKAA